MPVCPCCDSDTEYSQISRHWGSNGCNGPPALTTHQREMVSGLLAGDGQLNAASGRPALCVKSTNEAFLAYVANVFAVFTTPTGVTVDRSLADRRARSDRNAENITDPIYRVKTVSTTVFGEFYERWYPADWSGLVMPGDFRLTPVALRYWYVTDGSLPDEEYRDPGRANIACQEHFENRGEAFVLDLFDELGLEPSVTGGGVRFSPEETDAFFDVIGRDPVPGFEYKWPGSPGSIEPDGPVTVPGVGVTPESTFEDVHPSATVAPDNTDESEVGVVSSSVPDDTHVTSQADLTEFAE